MSPHVPLVARGIVTDIIRAKDNSSANGMAEEDVRAFTKAILALVQPAAGITLTPEVAKHRGLLAHDLRASATVIAELGGFGYEARAVRLRSLADALEASA